MYNLNVIKDAERKKEENKRFDAEMRVNELDEVKKAIVEALANGTTYFKLRSRYNRLFFNPKDVKLDDPNYSIILIGRTHAQYPHAYFYKLVKNKYYWVEVVLNKLLHIITLNWVAE